MNLTTQAMVSALAALSGIYSPTKEDLTNVVVLVRQAHIGEEDRDTRRLLIAIQAGLSQMQILNFSNVGISVDSQKECREWIARTAKFVGEWIDKAPAPDVSPAGIVAILRAHGLPLHAVHLEILLAESKSRG